MLGIAWKHIWPAAPQVVLALCTMLPCEDHSSHWNFPTSYGTRKTRCTLRAASVLRAEW